MLIFCRLPLSLCHDETISATLDSHSSRFQEESQDGCVRSGQANQKFHLLKLSIILAMIIS